ncbi:MAG: transcription antitermination factor NusB [Myxococcota bacterium]
MTSRSASRRRSREAALQVLYAADVKGREGSESVPLEEAFERVSAHFELPEGARAFAKELCCGVASNREDLDRSLAAHSEHWRLERMAAVDRNILRLAVYELLRTPTPASIVIDEAVELARRFGGERSPTFVNGVLGALAREVAE